MGGRESVEVWFGHRLGGAGGVSLNIVARLCREFRQDNIAGGLAVHAANGSGALAANVELTETLQARRVRKMAREL